MTQLIKECMLSILHGDSSFGIGFPLARVLFFLVWNCCKKHVPRVYTEKSGFSSTSVPERSPFCQNRLGHARSQRLIPVRQATIPWRMLNTLLTSLLCKCPGWPGKDFDLIVAIEHACIKMKTEIFGIVIFSESSEGGNF